MMLRNRAETEAKNFARLGEESNSHVIIYCFCSDYSTCININHTTLIYYLFFNQKQIKSTFNNKLKKVF